MSDQSNVLPLANEGVDAVTAWLSHASKGEYGFFEAVHIALVHFDKGNRDPLAKLLTVCNGKKGKRIRTIEGQKLVYASPLKRILQHALSGVSAKANASKDFGIEWTVATQGGVSPAKLALVFQLAKEGESPRGKTFKDVFPPLANANAKEKTAAELLAAKKAALAKWCGDHGFTLEVLAHTLTAKA